MKGKTSGDAGQSNVQAEFLKSVLTDRGLSAREVARRSVDIAKRTGMPELAVGHQAVSGWVKGSRHPNRTHRQLLASILGISLAAVNSACEGVDGNVMHRAWKYSQIVVHGALDTAQYTVPFRTDMNLSAPALYSHWADVFCFKPMPLMRHFKGLTYNLYGWIPDGSAEPMVAYYPCLMPLERVNQKAARRLLDTGDSAQRRVWFVYLPGGHLHVGIGHRDNGSFTLSHSDEGRLITKRFPLSKVDFAGYVTGRILFHLSHNAVEQNIERVANSIPASVA